MASLPDVSVLPDSSKMVASQKVGVKNTGYLDKKGTPSGESAKFNKLPPGMKIEDQEVADIRELSMKTYSGGVSYPGDGW